MRVLAYCAEPYADSTRRAAGVMPLTSPPLTAGIFSPLLLEGYDLLYFDLHGSPGQPAWLNCENQIALRADQIERADLGGAVVFALNCYLGEDDSPMLDALLSSGASMVIGGRGENFEYRRGALRGAGLLGLWFRRLLSMGANPVSALSWAKARLRIGKMTDASRDALDFRAYYRRVV